jgi:hypothetical protein
MKGMLSKAFSLALLISVVPSFAMDVKQAAEEVPAEVALVVNAAQQMADASSATTTAQNAVVSAGITIAAPTLWEQAKAKGNSLYNYVTNSRVAAYATTDNLKTAGKYALGLVAMYAGYKAIKSAYNYMTTPADKKAVVAPVAKKAVAKPAQEVVITPEIAQASCALMGSIVNDVYSKDAVAGLEDKYSKQLKSDVVLNRFVFNARTQLIESVEVAPMHQLLCDIMITLLHNVDKGSNTQKAEAKQVIVQVRNHVETIAAGIIGLEAMKPAPKATVARRVYNALVNRYTLGGAAVIGAGVAAYKFYNRAK